jgi:uncharacterized protein (DUF433 family)
MSQSERNNTIGQYGSTADAQDDFVFSKLRITYTIAIIDGEMTIVQVPVEYRTLDLCMTAIKLNGMLYRDVPQNVRTITLRLEAAIQTSAILEDFTPLEMKEVVALAFIKMYSEFIEYVPSYLYTLQFCLEAVQNGCKIEHIPDDLRTLEICSAAAEYHKRAHDRVYMYEYKSNDFRTTVLPRRNQ